MFPRPVTQHLLKRRGVQVVLPRSSPPSVSSWIVKGGTAALFNIVKLLIWIINELRIGFFLVLYTFSSLHKVRFEMIPGAFHQLELFQNKFCYLSTFQCPIVHESMWHTSVVHKSILWLSFLFEFFFKLFHQIS